MPSRRELTAHYEVTEPAIDRAMQTLRAKGLTETLAGGFALYHGRRGILIDSGTPGRGL